jgi:exodeoxyribonuclease VII small subunit
MSAKQNNSISKLSFEQAIKELTSIVGKIEQGQIPLQDSIEQYERGMALIKHCRGILQQAEKRIEKIAGEEESGDR